MSQGSNTSRFLGAAVALAATTIMVSSIPAPVSAHSSNAATQWQAQVESQIENNLVFPVNAKIGDKDALARVRVNFTPEGRYESASLAQSSGDATIDAEALRTARAVRYPVLPAVIRSHGSSVVMQVYFAGTNDDHYFAQADKLVKSGHQSALALTAPATLARR
ncbi:MAG: TonB family protein [Alphaproteobacteria bacterium]|nr:TonB family protein [Alphaproteobacteria bacterium]MDE2341333.1 TonB family protein [Alphaproteobacteria bacterium]